MNWRIKACACILGAMVAIGVGISATREKPGTSEYMNCVNGAIYTGVDNAFQACDGYGDAPKDNDAFCRREAPTVGLPVEACDHPEDWHPVPQPDGTVLWVRT